MFLKHASKTQNLPYPKKKKTWNAEFYILEIRLV